MKLFIAFTGLFMISQSSTGPIDILFLKGAGQTVTYEGKTRVIEPHPLRLVHHHFEQEKERWYLADGIEMMAEVEVEDPAVDVLRPGFLAFSDFYDTGCRPSLAPQCRGRLALQTCRSGDEKLLSGRFTLRGGSLQAAEVSGQATHRKSDLPPPPPAPVPRVPDPDDEAPVEPPPDLLAHQEIWQMKPIDKAAVRAATPPFEQTTLNGALYEIDLPANSETVSILVGDHRLQLPVKKQTACEELGHPDACAYLLVTSAFTRKPGEKDPHPGVDLHFALNYPLLDLPDGCPELIPIWQHHDGTTEPGGGSRCVPPVVGP